MNLPIDFQQQMKAQLKDAYANFEMALQRNSPTSIRINAAKIKNNPNLEAVPWCKQGFYLPQRPFFTADPSFHAGGYYVQEASSMLLEQAIEQYVDTDSAVVLDLCAAPGGKSTHLLSLLGEESLLVCNEVIASRSKILKENIQKWGAPNVVVANNDPAHFSKLRHFFDAIVIDAPCSGEGVFRKVPHSTTEWSPANVDLCAKRQRRILADIWDSLKPNGILVYSTCTYKFG